MDPNKLLKDALVLAHDLIEGTCVTLEPGPEADTLAELVLSLDEWLVKGGALPTRWNNVYRAGKPRGVG